MTRLGRLVLFGITATAVLLSVAPADATPPGENGRIAYRLFLNAEQTRAVILTIKPDGSGKRWVTHPARRVSHLTPDWSADGRWIAYVRARGKGVDSPSRSDWPRIFRIHPNGSGRKDLSASCMGRCRINDDPAWSPNGKRIAFTRVFREDLEEVDLMVMRADGTHVRYVTHHDPFTRNEDWAPQWSSSGKRLVFHRVDKRRELSAIFTIRLDGTGLRRLTPWRLNAGGEPDWSPNGRWVMFESADSVCLAHPNGNDRHCIASTDGGRTWGSGSFSPDGTMIVSPSEPGVGPAGNFDVYTMNIDGSGLFNVTQTNGWDGTPDWGPRRK
jgi:TolB protein